MLPSSHLKRVFTQLRPTTTSALLEQSPVKQFSPLCYVGRGPLLLQNPLREALAVFTLNFCNPLTTLHLQVSKLKLRVTELVSGRTRIHPRVYLTPVPSFQGPWTEREVVFVCPPFQGFQLKDRVPTWSSVSGCS